MMHLRSFTFPSCCSAIAIALGLLVTRAHVVHAESDPRPPSTSVGLGVGYTLPGACVPTCQLTPDVVSLRVRWPSGLVLEPTFSIGDAGSTVAEPSSVGGLGTPGLAGGGSSAMVGANVWIPIAMRGRVDFDAIASVTAAGERLDAIDGGHATSLQLRLGGGFGVAYWVSPNWQLSLALTNPLAEYATSSYDGGGSTSSHAESLRFVPTGVAMIHLWF